jgi:GDP-L-fucose synthase
MELGSKVYVAGHRGLVGSALVRRLEANGYRNIVTRTHAELDLTNQQAVKEFFQAECPEYVLLAAARVGGIYANNAYPADFIYQNLAIQTNVIHSAYEARVKKLLFLGSSCIYPKHAPQPMKEEHLLTGLLEPTNEPYAIAKIAGIKMCSAYNRQYGTNFLSVMPTNVYGPGDNYDPENSHVIPALICRAHEVARRNERVLTVWGTGEVCREFIYSDDLADACVFLMEKHGTDEVGEFINVGAGSDLSIRELAQLIAGVVGFQGEVLFDRAKPDGAPRKLLDITRMSTLGWQASTSLRDGLMVAYRDYLAHASVQGGLSPENESTHEIPRPHYKVT